MNVKRIFRYDTITLSFFLVIACSRSLHAQELYSGSMHFVFQPVNNITQFAVWVEAEDGEYIATAYITNFIGRNGGGNRTGDTDIDAGDGNRLSALPIWAYRRGVIDNTFGINNYYPPAESKPAYPHDIDAVSGATPANNNQRKTWQFSGLPEGNYKCRIEANMSFDFNDDHEYSFYRGQPSVVWSTTIHLSDNPDSTVVLDYSGYGSTDGSNGTLNPPDATITTAAELLSDLGGFRFRAMCIPMAAPDAAGDDVYSIPDVFCIIPNPVNVSAEISYSTGSPGPVAIKIISMQGNEIRTLVNDYHESGAFTIRFDTEHLSEGIYICRFQCGSGYTATRKIIVAH
jgi:hypothetical protein